MKAERNLLGDDGDNGREGCRASVIVVLDGIRTATDETGLAPLRAALREVVVEAEDKVLVLAILEYPKPPTPSPQAGYCCIGDAKVNHRPCEGASYVKFLHQEIGKREKAYTQIFRPYYERCKIIGVKFQVKIAAGLQPKDIILAEANNVKVTWIVMDRYFAKDPSIRLSRANCKIAFVSSDEDAIANSYMPANELGTSPALTEPNPKCSKQTKKSLPQEDLHNDTTKKSSPQEDSHNDTILNFEAEYQHNPPSLIASTSKEGQILTMTQTLEGSKNLKKVDMLKKRAASVDNHITCRALCDKESRIPLQLSWEVILEITGGFENPICIDHNDQSFEAYCGYLADQHLHVLVKKFIGDSKGILAVEKKVSLSMHHKNILGLIGYHESENGTILVFPHPTGGTMGGLLEGSMMKLIEGLAFEEKMKIAIEIAQGLRYMHEECPGGPIVHGDLRPCNIFLTRDLQPLITGFRRATWMQLEQLSSIFNGRGSRQEPSNLESLALVKSDVLSFGILLLRLFCGRSAPCDQRKLVEWARPLLQRRVYHKVLDEDADYSDIYGVLRVVCATAKCTKADPISQPCMSEVISLLKGETSASVQSSPSSVGSPDVDLETWLNLCT